MMQQETGDLKESEDGNVEFGTPTDDEEVTIPSQDRNREVPDFPDIDIRDEQSGGGPQLTPPPPPGVSTEWTEEIMAEDTSGRECPHDDFGI